MKKSFAHCLPVVALILVSLLASCVKKNSDPGSVSAEAAPDAVVKRFVEVSAGVKADGDREKLTQLCQGELRRAFERMTPEAFRVAYMSNSVKLKEFKVLETKVTDGVARVAYQVVLDNPQGTDATVETSSREVELVLSGNTWLIENIKPKGHDEIAFTRGMIF